MKQPLPATGGADVEPPDGVRTGAPRRALTLGRAVSIRDMEAFAAECSGVRAVSVAWAWDNKAQRPVVMVWVVGDGAVPVVQARLQAVTDPTTPISVQAAVELAVTLNVAVTTDANFIGSDVCNEVATALLAPAVGLLTVEQLGIGKAFYFSRLLAAIHGIPGVLSVNMSWTRATCKAASYGDSPGAGAYFGFPAGITLNGTEYSNG